MALTIDGNSLVFTGTVTVTNFINPANGVCTLTLTPAGGVGTLPALLAGTPGLSPTLTVGTVTTLSPGAQATFSLNLTTPGGPGTANAYTVNVGLPQGQAGSNGTNGTLAGCSDLTGTAAVGDIPMVTSISPTAFQYVQFPYAFVANPSTITPVSNASGEATEQLCAVSVTAQPFSWVPICFATVTVAGTINTVVNLHATLTAGARNGDIIGEAWGYAGQATQTLSMNSGFGALMSSTGYGVVPSGDTATIYLKAIEVASTADNWSISDTTASFTVLGIPVGR